MVANEGRENEKRKVGGGALSLCLQSRSTRNALFKVPRRTLFAEMA